MLSKPCSSQLATKNDEFDVLGSSTMLFVKWKLAHFPWSHPGAQQQLLVALAWVGSVFGWQVSTSRWWVEARTAASQAPGIWGKKKKKKKEVNRTQHWIARHQYSPNELDACEKAEYRTNKIRSQRQCRSTNQHATHRDTGHHSQKDISCGVCGKVGVCGAVKRRGMRETWLKSSPKVKNTRISFRPGVTTSPMSTS